ncbi:hypothetical protein RND81_08G089400 [Saponaria officinalis]|uniref:Uncharacterized protein n=1 Tax=Saponaria officinalis TaxID=3572 RepID=A0AAW1J5F3_SAPOF
MDKKSSRTDLLAAGRKKLQQYRQKKDPKVKDGKGSSKSSSNKLDHSQSHPKDAAHGSAESSHTDIVSEDSAALTVGDGDVDLPILDIGKAKFDEHLVETFYTELGSAVAAQGERREEGDQVSIEANSCGLTYHDQKEKDQLESDVSSVGVNKGDASVPVEATNVAESPVRLNSLEIDVMDESSNEKGLYQQSNLHDETQTDSKLHQPAAYTAMEIEFRKSMSSNPIIVDSFDEQSVFAGVEGSTLDLVQLAKVFKRLPETDFRYLIQSRKMADDDSLGVPQTDLPQTFQEQFYLANISKEFFHVQLLEQQEGFGHLVSDEASTSLLDLQESNKILASELAKCRSELEAAINKRVEFQDLYYHAKEEAIGYSATVDELRIRLEEALAKLFISSADSDHCKAQLEASLAENQELLKNLASSSEQKIKYEAVLEQYTLDSQKFSAHMADSNAQIDALQLEIEKSRGSLTFAIDERKKFEEENFVLAQDKEVLSGALADCRLQLTVSQQENSDLNRNLTILSEEHKKQKDNEEFLIQEVERLTAELVVFQDKWLTQHQEIMILNQDKEGLSGDLVDCRHQLTVLQHENSDLTRRVAVMNEEHEKQMDYEESIIQEIERLSAELVVFQDKLWIQHQEKMQVEADLGEAMLRIEQLAEENIILQSSVEIYKGKLSDGRHMHVSSAGVGSMTQMNIVDNVADGTISSELSLGDASVLAMKNCLEEAEMLMKKLEKATDAMHSHSVSLSHSIGKNTAPGVSKLIQAFESKAIDDPDPDDVNPSTDNPVPSYLVAIEQISHLRCVLETLSRHVEHVDVLTMEEKVRCQAADVSCEELEVEIESLKGISNNLEVRNIELEVLCGAMNQHARDTEASQSQLVNMFDALKQEYAALKSQNVELINKLTTGNSRISELQAFLQEIRRSSDELASTFYNEIEALQAEMKQNIYSGERRWKSALSQLHSALVNLDALIGSSVIYPPPTESSDSGILDHILLSLCAACEVIEKLMLKVETHETLSNSYTQVKDQLHSVDEKHNLSLAMLQKVSADLVKLLDISSELYNDSGIPTVNQYDPMDADYYEAIVSKVGNLVGDLQALKESNKKLYSDLLNRTNEIEELNKHCLDSDAVLKLVLDVKEVLKLQDTDIDLDNTPVLLLQSSVLLLIQKFRETEEKAYLLTEECNSRVIEIGKLQDNIEQLNILHLQHQNEMLILKESLTQAKNALDANQVALLEKTKELEQSDQRVASVREKLSIAVAKGKGLVVQRDSLKHSLAEMSSELDKCSQELELKDSRILEIEEKLKAYSEAGERMEALESELTYIRNSATALRESFLMKDSALQRIEEIMEDLELPYHFHSKDTAEKVDWLAKSVAGNSFLHADWDQRSSVGGGSYSDAGLATDGGKEDVHPTLNPVDDLRRQYDELQTKFYELAEQNDMLEQSLMERNVLVQRWEEILDRINTPPQIRSMEPEERIHWLGTALSEADHHMRSLQQKIEKLENYCQSLSSDLEESQGRISELQSSLQAIAQEKDNALSIAGDHMKSYPQKINSLESYSGSLSSQLEESERRISEYKSSLQMVIHDKEILSSNLVALTCNHELALHAVAQYEHDLDILRKDADMLRGSLVEKVEDENYIQEIESELRRLQGLILEVLKESGTDSSDLGNIQCLERLIRKLVTRVGGIDSESHAPNELVQGHVPEHEVKAITAADLENVQAPNETVGYLDESKPRSYVTEGKSVSDLLRIELAEALDEVAHLREENDEYSKKNQSMTIEFEELDKKKDELQELLNQEEQKSASLREKLNLAVRKGKSLIQQRDSLKQNIELSTNEIDRLKSEISRRDNSLLDSSKKISDLSLEMETYKTFEAENLSLKNRLIVAEQHLQHIEHTMSMLLNKLGETDTGGEITTQDPLPKVERIGKMCSELHATTASLEKDARKSKKAAELLLAELNEVQERNDGLQEELARAYQEISTLSRERDLADVAKVEALSHFAKLSDERKLQLTEMERLQFSISDMKKVFFDMSSVADNAFAKDLELLSGVKAHVESCLVHIGVNLVSTKEHGGLVSVNKTFKDFWSRGSPWNSEVFDELDDSVEFDVFKAAEQHLKQLTEAVGEFKDRLHSHSMSLRSEVDQVYSVVTTVLKAVDSQRNSLELIKDERDMERAVLCKSLSFLYEACCSSITEIENRRAQLSGQSLAAGDLRVNLPSLPSFDGGNLDESSISSYEQCVKALADILIGAVKDFTDMEIEDTSRSKEMRSDILHLQKELQEKDIQRERICSELVGQIKEAESAATNCSRDFQLAKNYAHDLEQKLEAMGKEQALLEQRVVELQQGHVNSIELGEKVKAMTTAVAAKEQEIEALMQALDEEETQMEALRIKVEELESAVQKKNSDLDHVEAYRAKAAKKLSVTVSKFDELHCMSEGLLSEIEVLQSQLQDRDSEISFLRHEVTRCTNDVLEATKMSKERSYSDLHEFLTWLDITLSRVLLREPHGDDGTGKNCAECKEKLQKDILSIISELEDSRIAAQNKDALLQAERNKVEELSQTKAALESSLNETELHLNSLQGAGISGELTSEIVEIEPVVNKWTAPVVSSTSQVRNWRKANSDQVAIAIDTDAGSSGRLEDEDDDKVHGFKSLTTSKFVPKFTRPVSDMIDGLWVSCDRTLMRQPAFRLGIIFYWALLHAMLASIMV